VLRTLRNPLSEPVRRLWLESAEAFLESKDEKELERTEP
jgi:hypothetical protein